jgi:hypothetical protein
MNAEFEARGDLFQRGFGAVAAGQAVGDNANMVTAVGLPVGEVHDVTEYPADRRANDVENAKRFG